MIQSPSTEHESRPAVTAPDSVLNKYQSIGYNEIKSGRGDLNGLKYS